MKAHFTSNDCHHEVTSSVLEAGVFRFNQFKPQVQIGVFGSLLQVIQQVGSAGRVRIWGKQKVQTQPSVDNCLVYIYEFAVCVGQDSREICGNSLGVKSGDGQQQAVVNIRLREQGGTP